MPVIPQYNAATAAQQQAPTLQRPTGVRADASQQLGALAGLSNQIQNGIKPIGRVTENPSGAIAAGEANLAQGVASLANSEANLARNTGQGLQSLGEGIKQYGQALFNIRAAEANARNDWDVHQNNLRLDEVARKFGAWKERNDPRNWVAGWEEHAKELQQSSDSGVEISPAAQRVIQKNTENFISRYAIETDIAAIKKTSQQSREALTANYLRAVKSQNLPEAVALSRYGAENGMFGEDDAVKMELNAQDQIESKQIEQLTNQIDTALLYGNITGALELADMLPVSDDEKNLKKAQITEQSGYRQLIKDAEDILDPTERIKALQTDTFNKLRPFDKKNLIDASYREANAESVVNIGGLKDSIDRGEIANSVALIGSEDFGELSESDKASVIQYFEEGASNDIADFLTMQRTIRGYDPANDPRGVEQKLHARNIALNFEEDRAVELQTLLQEASNPESEPVSASQRVVSDIFSAMQDRYESGEIGEYRITGDQIAKRTGEDGETFYTVEDPSGSFKKKGLFGTTHGRVVELSERDKLKFEEGKTESGDVYEDIKAKESAFGRFLEVQQTVERMIDTGEISDADEILDKVSELMGGELKGSLDSMLQLDPAVAENKGLPGNSFGTVSGNLFPAGTAQLSNEVEKLLNATNF